MDAWCEWYVCKVVKLFNMVCQGSNIVLQGLNLGLSSLKPGLAELEPLVRPWSILGSSLVRPWLLSLVCPWLVLGHPWWCLGCVLGLSLSSSFVCPVFVLGESLVVALVLLLLLLSWLGHWVVLGLSWVVS